jgi:ABC-2 type transport system permease protein
MNRPLLWSVRRELWENRSIYLAPLIVAGVILFGFLISTVTLPRRIGGLLPADAGQQQRAIELPYDMLAGMVLITAFIVGAFYCLDALHGERRDRSILFWKSLPVSDRTTVLSKAAIPLVILPLLVLAIVVIAHTVMLTASTIVLAGNGASIALLWSRLPFFQIWVGLLYALIAASLWHAPIYGWLLLVSGWTRRATFIWAVLPLAAITVFEGITFHTWHFGRWLGYRMIGWFAQAFVPETRASFPRDPLAHLTPGKFLTTPGLWVGLLLAAAFVYAAVRLRRGRGPI